jgi:1,4-alpha-glucan branching enzyme
MAEETKAAIQLSLFAPYNEEVALIASWNDWQRQPMAKAADGWWRIDAQLGDGEYFYKFVVKSKSYFCVNQWVDVFDPYGLSVNDDDQERNRLTVRDGKRMWVDYQWRHDDVPLPTNDKLVIYELHVGDFSGGKGDEGKMRLKGRFSDIVDKLDYLNDLGVNALELMPVQECRGYSWGYNPRSLFAVASRYGTPADLCRLVDECHGRGVRVIIDAVYNHADAGAPLTKIDYEYWFYRENPDPPQLHWGPKFNYGHYDEKLKLFPARKYVIDSINFWVENFRIDGIRFDATVAIKDFKLLKELADAAFKKIDGRKPFITIGEHIPEDPAIVGYPKAGPMVAAWRDSLAKQLQAIATTQERDGAQPWDLDALERHVNPATNGYGSGNHTVNYLASHDHERIFKQVADIGKKTGDAAFRRVKLASGILFTVPGIPMIWMGQEFGTASPLSMSPRPLAWELLANRENQDLHNYFAGSIKLRANTPALRTDQYQTVMKDKERALFAYKRWDDGGGVIIVAANLKDSPAGEFVIANAGLPDGTWHEHNFNYDAKVEKGVLKDTLGPSEIKIFIKQ